MKITDAETLNVVVFYSYVLFNDAGSPVSVEVHNMPPLPIVDQEVLFSIAAACIRTIGKTEGLDRAMDSLGERLITMEKQP